MASARRSNPNGVGNAFHGTPNFSILSDFASFFEKRDKKLFRTFQHKEKLKRTALLETYQEKITKLVEHSNYLARQLYAVPEPNLEYYPQISFSTLQVENVSKIFTMSLTPVMVKKSKLFIYKPVKISKPLVTQKTSKPHPHTYHNPHKSPPPVTKRRKADVYDSSQPFGMSLSTAMSERMRLSPTKLQQLYPSPTPPAQIPGWRRITLRETRQDFRFNLEKGNIVHFLEFVFNRGPVFEHISHTHDGLMPESKPDQVKKALDIFDTYGDLIWLFNGD